MHKHLIISISPIFLACPCAAQGLAEGGEEETIIFADTRPSETQITVIATGVPSEIEDTGQAVTVMARGEIEAVQGADLARVLARVPGVTLSRNGSAGSFTGVRLRGAEAEQAVVILDGVRVSDPAAPGGGFDFGNLGPGNLETIELMRGSNSTIWGSDAIGGVILFNTRATGGFEASAEYGARNTAYSTVSGGIGGDHGFLGGGASWFRSDGFSSFAGGTEADGFEQWDANAQGRVYFSDSFEVFARGRYARGRLDIDGYPAPAYTFADSDEFQRTRQYSGAAGAVRDNGVLYLAASWSFADTERDSFDPASGPAPGYTTDGHSDRLGLTGEWRAIGPLFVDFGASYEWSRFATLFDPTRSTGIGGAYLQLGVENGPFSAHAGGRHDDHRQFGGATTLGADLSWEVATDLRLRASFGEGFKVPSLFQLHSDFGNAALRPERSTGFDVGLAWRERGSWPHAIVTLFRRQSENLIGFVSCFGTSAGLCAGRPFGTYDNVGRARSRGLELEAGAQVLPGVTLLGAWSLSDNADRTPGSARFGLPLARRPRHALSLTGEWDTGGPVLGADLRWVSRSFDDPAAAVRLPAWATLDLLARWPVSAALELFGRVENVWGERYQTAAGYASAGRGVFVGVRLR